MDIKDYLNRNVRLEPERWTHIIEHHPEATDQTKVLMETMNNPDLIQEGNQNELLAFKKFRKTPVTFDKFCVVVYKLMALDGFILTMYFTRRPSYKRKIIWKRR